MPVADKIAHYLHHALTWLLLHLGCQLRAADIVVLNKCDLASLGTVSSVEDKVQEVAPGVKMLRARFGQVGDQQGRVI